MAGSKVRWSEEEEQTAINNMITIKTNNPLMDWGEAMAQANSLMPSERRKALTSLKRSHSLGLIGKARALTIIPQSDFTISGTVSPNLIEEPNLLGTNINNPSIQDGIEALATAIVRNLKPLLVSKITKMVFEIKDSLPQPVDLPVDLSVSLKKEIEREHKPIALCVGLIPPQISLLREEYAKTLDLRFFEATQNYNEFKSKAASVSHVLVNVSKINHSLFSVVKSTVPKEKICLINGGLTSFRNILNSLRV